MLTQISIHKIVSVLIMLSLAISGYMLSGQSDENLQTHSDHKVFEMRTYTTHDGKLDDLHKRFEDHTMRLFEKHGMSNIGYWVPKDEVLSENTLIYILSHESLEAAENSWDAFREDPEWQKAYEESHADGVIVKEVESVFMDATPYSGIQ